MMLSRALSLALAAALAAMPGATSAEAAAKKAKGPANPGARNSLPARVDPALQAQIRATPLAVREQARALQIRVQEESSTLRDLRSRAATARSSEDKRLAWSEHSRLLYGEMRRRAPGLKPHIDLLEKIARSRFEPPKRRSEGIDSYGFDRSES